jgi:hypothetical protein
MGSKNNNQVSAFITGLGFMLASALPDLAVTYLPKYNIGKILAILALFIYTMPVLIAFTTLSFVVLIIEQTIDIIRNENN